MVGPPPPKFCEEQTKEGTKRDEAAEKSMELKMLVANAAAKAAKSAAPAQRERAIAAATMAVLEASAAEEKTREENAKATKPATKSYEEPPWKGVPKDLPYKMEVIKEGVSWNMIPLSEKSCYTFGRQPDCDIVLDHPSSSRIHAIVQYRQDGAAFIFDFNSTHGTFVNKKLLKAAVYAPLRVGDVVRFGQSSRLHIFMGPEEFMPKEGPNRQERQQMRALEAAADENFREKQLQQISLAKTEATWGMDEDEIPQGKDAEQEVDTDWRKKFEKGELTEKQTQTAEKIFKKERTMANLKSEMERIYSKEANQQGLTEGQQTQIARNEKRLLQLQEELEEAEDLLLDSVAEAQHAKQGRKKRKAKIEDEGLDSDDDEFYDRTDVKKKKKKKREQKVETIESLWDQMQQLSQEKEVLMSELDAKVKEARGQTTMVNSAEDSGADSLDAYINSVKNQVKQEQVLKVQQQLTDKENEIQSVKKLMRLADPNNLYQPVRVVQEDEKDSKRESQEHLHEANKDTGGNTGGKPKHVAEAGPSATTPQYVKSSPPKFDSSDTDQKKVRPSPPRFDAIQENTKKATVVQADEDGFMDRATLAAALQSGVQVRRIGQLEIRKKPPVFSEKSASPAKVNASQKEQDIEANVLKQLDILRGAHRTDTSIADMDPSPGGDTQDSWIPPSGQTGDGKTNMNKRLGY